MKNWNRFEITGYICGRGLFKDPERGLAKVTLAHPSKDGFLYTDLTVWEKNHSHKVDVPWAHLEQKQLLYARGYLKTYLKKDPLTGRTRPRHDYIALEVRPLDKWEASQVRNVIRMTGYVCGRGLKADGSPVRFTIGHSQGRNVPAVFLDCTMFEKNGGHDVLIPRGDLKRGARITVSGYRKPTKWEKDGVTYRGEDFIALEATPA